MHRLLLILLVIIGLFFISREYIKTYTHFHKYIYVCVNEVEHERKIRISTLQTKQNFYQTVIVWPLTISELTHKLTAIIAYHHWCCELESRILKWYCINLTTCDKFQHLIASNTITFFCFVICFIKEIVSFYSFYPEFFYLHN